MKPAPSLNCARAHCIRSHIGCLAVAFALTLATAGGVQFHITPDVQAVLDRISADSLRTCVSFLASDALEGRYTPSPGLTTAAEYIAAQFRNAGLQPMGSDGYLQTAAMMAVTPNFDGFEFFYESRNRSIHVSKENVERQGGGPVDITHAPLTKVDGESVNSMAKRTPDQIQGRVVLVTPPQPKPFPWATLARLEPLLVVLVGDGVALGGQSSVHLRYPDDFEPPWLLVQDPDLLKAVERAKNGPIEGSIAVRLAAPAARPVKLCNVVAMLPGSDTTLKDTCLLVSAHYDHLGRFPFSNDHPICNGANDDASGTAAVIEVANALAGLRVKPKRSLVFVAFFGEERGKIGSQYYSHYPSFPLERTVANINLEQIGRTDDSDGAQIARVSLTGFDYSDVGQVFQKAATEVGVLIVRRRKYSDSYFRAGDSQIFADLGIPAHMLFVSYEFPDYHRPGDDWNKIDYENMRNITQAVALGVLAIANNPEPPQWNETNPKAKPYIEAGRRNRKQ